MYWFSCCETIGNCPVWSIDIIPINSIITSLCATRCTPTLWWRFCRSAPYPSNSSSIVSTVFDCVLDMPCQRRCRCPAAVSSLVARRTIPWAYQIDFSAIFVRTLLKDNISTVLILQRLYRSKNKKYTKIHHFDQWMDHSRNQPTFSTITIQTNHTLLYRPIKFLYTLNQPTSLTSNVLLILLFHSFRIFLKTARRLFQYPVSLRQRHKVNSFFDFISEALLA